MVGVSLILAVALGLKLLRHLICKMFMAREKVELPMLLSRGVGDLYWMGMNLLHGMARSVIIRNMEIL